MNKIRLSTIIKIILPIIIVSLFSRCMQDEYNFSKLDDEMELEIGILAPVAYGSLTLDDLISQFDSTSFIDTDPEGLLFITYEDSLASFSVEEFLDVPDQEFFQYYYDSDYDIPPFIDWGDTLAVNRSTTYPFTFTNNEKLDSIILDDGNFHLDVSSSFLHDGTILLTMPNVTRNGISFSETIKVSRPSGGYDTTYDFSLAGYVIALDNSNPDTSLLQVDFGLEFVNSGNGMSEGDNVLIETSIQNIDFGGVFGYIGDYDMLGQEGSLNLGFFEKAFDGNIRFENPQINFKINNSFGVPAEVDINRFTGFKEGDSIQLDISPSANPFRYAYPTLTDYLNSDYLKDTVLSINGTNSEISDFLAFLPSSLEYNMSATSNPDGEGGSYNFLTDESKIDVEFEFMLPLWFEAEGFAYVDTLEDVLKAGWDENTDMVERITVMLEVANGLPLDIEFQVTFIDSLYNPVDSLFAENEQPIISAGELDNEQERVESPGIKTTVIQYTNDEILDLTDARHVIIRAGLQTPTIDDAFVPVKFYSDYSIEYNLSIGANIKANTNDF